jgi:membrane protein DedA with SNARE-associated domain
VTTTVILADMNPMTASAAAGSGTDELTGITGWAADVMTNLGGPGVGAIVALENLFPPIPSEVVLPLAGFLAGQGNLSVVAVILWATAGSVVGAVVLYGLGAVLGRDRLRRIADRVPLASVHDLDRAEQWFARRGGRAVFVGRMVPVVRSFVSVPAGVERMPLPKFVAYTTAGSALWNALFVLLG